MKKDWIKRLLIVLMGAIIAAGLLEGALAGITYMKAGEYKGKALVPSEQISVKGFDVQNGIYTYKEMGGEITLKFDKQYVNKFQYLYESDGDFLCDIQIYGYDVYGKSKIITVKDKAAKELQRSVVNIKEKVEKIVLSFDLNQAYLSSNGIEAGAEDTNVINNISMRDFALDNTFRFNPLRMLFFLAVLGLIGFFFAFRKEVGLHIELGFLASALVMGLLFVVMLPPNLQGWDEHIHLTRAYTLFQGEELTVPKSVAYMADHPEGSNEWVISSAEEKVDIIRYYNAISSENAIGEQTSPGLQSAGYLLSALVVTLGSALSLPFYFVYLMGKGIHVILYAFLGYWAIRHARIGKGIFTAIGLYPLAIFITSIYTYDIIVAGFMLAGLSIMVSEFAVPDKPMAIKDGVLFLVFLVIASIPKAVYIPFLLLALCLPAKKFRDKKQMWIYKGLICLAFFALLSTFILPTLFAPPSTGDIRGGDTNTAEQLQLIFKQPFAYAYILWENVKNTFGSFMYGGAVQTPIGYLGIMNSSYLLAIYLFLVTLTDTGYQYEGERAYLSVKYRLVIAAGGVITIALIWTAMYLSFTEVGKTEIAGVQGRYYLPFMAMFFLLLQSQRVQVALNRVKYNLIILSISSAFLVKTVYDLMWNMNI